MKQQIGVGELLIIIFALAVTKRSLCVPIGVLPGRWHIKETDICQLYPLASLLVNREHTGAMGFTTHSSYSESVDSLQPESFYTPGRLLTHQVQTFFYWFINNRSRL